MKLTVLRFILILLAGIALGNIWTKWSKHRELQKAFTDTSQFDEIVFRRLPTDSATVKFRLLFHNNPLEFDSTYTMWVALNHVLVYEGPYSDERDVFVPENFIGQGVRPYLLIRKGDKLFDGWKKEKICFFLHTEPVAINTLHVYFRREFTAPGNYIMFSGELAQ